MKQYVYKICYFHKFKIIRMNYFPYVLWAVLALLFPLIKSDSVEVQLESKIVNNLNAYTLTFTFANNTIRSITINFPASSDLSSSSLAIYVNSDSSPLNSGSYTIDNTNKKITINNQTPQSNVLKFKVTNVKNPPSAIQVQLSAVIVPSNSLISTLFFNYEKGQLLSCKWTFQGSTGSTNNVSVIDVVLGNRLLIGVNQIQIRFPNNFQDSDTAYLTDNSIPVIISFSIDNGTTYLSPLSRAISRAKISLSVSLTSQLSAGALLKVKLTGITSPPTSNPSGTGFIVSTFDKDNQGIDTINKCDIEPLKVMQLTGVFDNSFLKVGENYGTPKITVNFVIPFTVLQFDILQLDHNQAMNITKAGSPPLSISFFRGRNIVYFNPESSFSATSTTRYFKGNIRQANQTSNFSEFQFTFDIRAPHSQKPWNFVIWLRRSSGAYVKITAILQAYAISIDSAKVGLSAASTQMSVKSQHTLNIQLQKAISKDGKILLGFNQEYSIQAGSCTGYIGPSQITSSPPCQMIANRNGLNWLVYKIGQNSTSVLFDAGSILKIQYPTLIKNPLYLKTYQFRLQIYYTQQDDSLVSKAQIFGSITTTTYNSKKGSLVSNDNVVYQNTIVVVNYVNQVYVPQDSYLQFQFPSEVFSFDFQGKITIAGADVSVTNFLKNLPGKTLKIQLNQNFAPSTVWKIPIMIQMPAIQGDYPSIVLKVTKSSSIYEQITTGLQLRVNKPSSKLTVMTRPKTNTTVDALTDYQLTIQSQVPLPTIFYVVITVPLNVGIVGSLACSSNRGNCLSISNLSTGIMNLTINSPYTTADTSQQFIFTISTLSNPRSTAPSSPWNVQIKGLYNGILGAISYDTAVSDAYTSSTGLICVLDPTKNYYKSNTQNVLLSCNFHNNLVQGDYMQITITSGSYKLNPSVAFLCTSMIPVGCQVFYSSDTTLVIKVVVSTLPSNKKQLNLEISGLVSNAYTSSPVSIAIQRFDSFSNQIDTGVFFYDISCNQNVSIQGKKCKTCYDNKCTQCYPLMYLLNNDSCVNNCRSQTQFRALNNNSTSQCQSCLQPCYTCESVTRCLSCNNQFLYLLTTDHTCVSQCNTSNSFWVNLIGNPPIKMCDICLSQCKICVNNSINGCLQCDSSKVLQNGQCKSTCSNPRSYNYNGVCYSCDAACQTCTGAGSNNCVQCKELYYMNNGFCVSQCPSNKYTLSNGTCGCQGSCSTCTSTSPTNCSSCINPLQMIFNGSCLDSCPLYTFELINNCISCPSNCIQCMSSTSCSKCAPTYYIYESKCYFDCNSISYQYDFKGQQCVLCPTGCDRCNGTQCLSCLAEYSKVNDSCIKSCILTNSCVVKNPVPETILTVPGSVGFFIWTGIVLGTKFFVPKLYIPYAIVFFTSVIQCSLIISTTIYSKQLSVQAVRRVLASDLGYRTIILDLLIVALVVNYLTNIVFAVIFYKYIVPLVKAPRQIDYITIGLALIIGMLTNYRFCLIIFSKMFPKPNIQIQFSSRLTPIHYLCVTSLFLSGFALGASGLILKNQYPLTDMFMLGVDILVIQLILVGFSIWMIAFEKPASYFQNQIKKYHIEQIYRTQQGMLSLPKDQQSFSKDENNHSKYKLRIKDEFDQENLQNIQDTMNFDKRLLEKMTTMNLTKQHIPQSDNQKPLARITREYKVALQGNMLRSSNKVANVVDTDISGLSLGSNVKKKKLRDTSQKQEGNKGAFLQKRQKQNVIDFNKERDPAIYKSSNKLRTSDEDNMPRTLERKTNAGPILTNIHEPSSDQIPNLPLNDSIFHQKASSQFGHKVRPKKVISKANQKSLILNNKSPLRSNRKNNPAKSNRNNNADFSKSQNRQGMKKKNKYFQSQLEGVQSQEPQDAGLNTEQLDFQSIINSKIVVIGKNDRDKDNGQINLMHTKSMENQNNISQIEKKQQENSDFNEEISPSWFNVQNQRFDLSSNDSDFPQN